MATQSEALNVEVLSDAIEVTLPGTCYAVKFPKPQDPNALVGSEIDWLQDERTSMTPTTFLNRAHEIALTRARELGWIK